MSKVPTIHQSVLSILHVFLFYLKVPLDSVGSPKKTKTKTKTKHQIKSIKTAIYDSKAIIPGRLLNYPYVP